MKIACVRRAITICLILCLLCSNITPAFALAATNGMTKIEDIGSGKMFIQETDEKLAAIGADNATHTITISIKYAANPSAVYQWVFNDYPEVEFDMSNISFWEEVINYAESKTEQATVVHFVTEEIPEDEPMVLSSAGADLREDLEGFLGTEYSNKHVSTKVMDGKIFQLYENLSFNIYSSGVRHSWNTGITISSLVAGVLGLTATTATMSTICGVLGIAFTVASMTLSSGKINQYTCAANYNRYVKMQSGTTYYALSDKIVSYTGYEDASLNSSGRASIVSATRSERYSHSQSHFNNGIFDEAYNNYILGV